MPVHHCQLLFRWGNRKRSPVSLFFVDFRDSILIVLITCSIGVDCEGAGGLEPSPLWNFSDRHHPLEKQPKLRVSPLPPLLERLKTRRLLLVVAAVAVFVLLWHTVYEASVVVSHVGGAVSSLAVEIYSACKVVFAKRLLQGLPLRHRELSWIDMSITVAERLVSVTPSVVAVWRISRKVVVPTAKCLREKKLCKMRALCKQPGLSWSTCHGRA